MLSIILKTKVPTLNDWNNKSRGSNGRYIVSKWKKIVEKDIAWEVLSQTKLMLQGKYDFDIEWSVTTKHDPDNIFFGVKFILDAFVKAGLLPNDTNKHVGTINNTHQKTDSYSVKILIKEHGKE